MREPTPPELELSSWGGLRVLMFAGESSTIFDKFWSSTLSSATLALPVFAAIIANLAVDAATGDMRFCSKGTDRITRGLRKYE